MMNKFRLSNLLFAALGCYIIHGCNTKNLNVITDLPYVLSEVSGIAVDRGNDLLWMVNDSGNEPVLFRLNAFGEIVDAFKVKAKNKDWEDLTTDNKGNIYIGDFGNNQNKRKNLRILKIDKKQINSNSTELKPAKISFYYPEQTKFPPKKDKRVFDCEAFFYNNGYLYLFTKSRAKQTPVFTDLYKIPATEGQHKAEYLGSLDTCDESECWVTSADINQKGDKIAILTENSVFVLTDFEGDNILGASMQQYYFQYASQKESVAFKNDSTLFIADEYTGYKGGNLYEFSIR